MNFSCAQFPCIHDARQFDISRYIPFCIESQRVGWIRRSDLSLLEAWPHFFMHTANALCLSPVLKDCEMRTQALSQVIQTLAQQKIINGWRDERYAIRRNFEEAPYAWIERAAARFFGIKTYAVHVNGITHTGIYTGVQTGTHTDINKAPYVWIARRSLSKSTDPGMLDNLVGGGIGNQLSIQQTLFKESWEEAGIERALAAHAVQHSSLYIRKEIPEGLQVEQVFVFDLNLDKDFFPKNQDGEVSEFYCASIEQLIEWLSSGMMTVDASLVSLDYLSRMNLIDASVQKKMSVFYREPLDLC